MKKLFLLFCGLCISFGLFAQSVFVNDSGTIRKITGIYVNDAGTIRKITSVYVNDAGTIRKVWAAGISFSMTVGNAGNLYGYNDSPCCTGSISGVSGPPGITPQYMIDTIPPSSTAAEFHLKGFSSDPGSTYIKSVTAAGTTLNATSATYAYGAGVASWQWLGSNWGLAAQLGNTIPVVVLQ